MRRLMFAAAAMLLCAASSSQAQNVESPQAAAPHDAQVAPGAPSAPKPSTEPSAENAPGASGRYSLNRVDGGFLRLDNRSGQIAFCNEHAAGWACQMVAEDRAALEKEIARLQDEIASLKRDVAALRQPPPPPPGALPPPAADRSEDSAKLREELARARVAFENAWRLLVEMIVNFQKDMMRKG